MEPVLLSTDAERREKFSSPWLLFIAIAGLVLIGGSIWLALERPARNGIWSAVALEVGATFLLFSVLFYVERRFVRREVRSVATELLRALRPDEPLPEEAFTGEGQIGASRAAVAAMEVASTWHQALVAGYYAAAWALSEENWRLCRAQAWVWRNRGVLGLSDLSAMQKVAEDLSKVGSTHPLAPDFMRTEREEFLETRSGVPANSWGTASRRRCVGPGYEAFLFMPLTGKYKHGFLTEAPAAVPNSHLVLMHLTAEGWRFAAIQTEAPPSQDGRLRGGFDTTPLQRLKRSACRRPSMRNIPRQPKADHRRRTPGIIALLPEHPQSRASRRPHRQAPDLRVRIQAIGVTDRVMAADAMAGTVGGR